MSFVKRLRNRCARVIQGGPRMFVPPGHFYSPICDEAEAGAHIERVREAAPRALPGIRTDQAEMAKLWHAMLAYLNSAPFSDQPAAGFRYHYDNPAYAWGDGSILHAMIRHLRPRRIIEVGSGWSSACSLDTVERFLDNSCDLTFIDPYPELAIETVGVSRPGVLIIDRKVQDVDFAIFDALEENDILFIDSTHVLKTGSDVAVELFEILPRLKMGVVVHIHDMFWPFEYPESWVVAENRSWNELQAVRAFLYENSAWDIMWFTDYMMHVERPLIETTCPRVLRNSGGALWLRRRFG
jgi:hypothetical protein